MARLILSAYNNTGLLDTARKAEGQKNTVKGELQKFLRSYKTATKRFGIEDCLLKVSIFQAEKRCQTRDENC